MTAFDDWLGQVEEEAIEPARPIIDPHHHLWAFSPEATYRIPELWADTGTGHSIIGTVFVECGAGYRTDGPEALRPVGETDFVVAEARTARAGMGPGKPPVLGIVGHANLMLGGEVETVLAAHVAAGEGLFRGIRHSAAYDPSPDIRKSHSSPPPALYLRPDFREGFARLAAHGLSFDAWLYHPQIPDLTNLARAFPGTLIVFDHFGGPLGIGPYAGRQAEIFGRWKADVAELARCPNVVAKLGGLAMPINGWDFHKQDCPARSAELVAAHRDYYLHTIDCFGPDRCMFESNFPVDKRSVSYGVLWNALKTIAAPFSEDEKTAMFRGTAERVYRLAAPAAQARV